MQSCGWKGPSPVADPEVVQKIWCIQVRNRSKRFNREGQPVFDHRIWVIASDGDLMEGVASEACSLAGHLGLGKLIVFYDNNHIQLAGETAMAFSEDVGKRFEAYGWHVQDVGEAWLRLLLEVRPTSTDAAAAAAGWDGGQYRAWSDGSRVAVLMRTTWDSSTEAQQFAEAMGRWLGGGTAQVEAHGSDVDVLFGSDRAALSALRKAAG